MADETSDRVTQMPREKPGTCDKFGVEYARLSQLRPGDEVVMRGFKCVEEGGRRLVRVDAEGFFVTCATGHHGLEGQVTSRVDDHLVGVYRCE